MVSLTNILSNLFQQTQYSAQHTALSPKKKNTVCTWNISSPSPHIVSLIFHTQWLDVYSTWCMYLNHVRISRKLSWWNGYCTKVTRVYISFARFMSVGLLGVIPRDFCLFSSLIRDGQCHILAAHSHYSIRSLGHLPVWHNILNFLKSSVQLGQRAITGSF